MEPSTTRVITLEELAKHNKREDAWLALRGKVFNVTDYVPSHPGGYGTISKGFGKDATSLFNAAHSYVNFEAKLQGKQMGILDQSKSIGGTNAQVASKPGLKGGSQSQPSATNVGTSGFCCMCLRGAPKFKENFISFTEDDIKIFFEVTTCKSDPVENDWTIAIIDKDTLLINNVVLPPNVWIGHYKLTQPLMDDTLSVTFKNNFQKMTIVLMKPEAGERWKKIGEPLEKNGMLTDSRTAPENMQGGVIIAKENVTHDVIRYSIELNPSVKLGIPVGFHVKVRVGSVQRRYTPVCYSFTEEKPPKAKNNGQVIHLIMKLYSDGELTPLLNDIPLDTPDQFLIGDVCGDFDKNFFNETGMIVFFAGGTGITPFIGILDMMIKDKAAVRGKSIILIYFNHKEKDVVFKSQFESIAERYSWFTFFPVLTKPDDDWLGIKGHASVDMINNKIQYPPSMTSTKAKKVLICGSPGFNECCKALVESLPFPTKDVHVFEG